MVKHKRESRKDEVTRLGRAMYARKIRRKVAKERKGRIVATGGLELVERLERDGYESWR